MKKIITILLGVLLFAFPLAACADTPTGKPDDGGAAYVDPDLPDGTTENLEGYDLGAFDLGAYMTPIWNDGGVAVAEPRSSVKKRTARSLRSNSCTR